MMLRAAMRAAASQQTSAFYIVDLNILRQQHQRWKRHLPRVHPHYAIKCNPDKILLELMGNELNMGFDCASASEIDVALTNVTPDRIVYANPIKAPEHLLHAANLNVQQVTVDSVDEVRKVAALHPHAQVIVRIHVDDKDAICRLGLKFGASLHDVVPDIIQEARRLQLDVSGVAFHAGSGQSSPAAFTCAISRARAAFDMGVAAGFDMRLLDIGGGFNDDKGFSSVANACRTSLDMLFPNDYGSDYDGSNGGVRIIAEPGRFMVSACSTLVTRVIGRRLDHEGNHAFFVNDSIYGSFNNVMYDHASVHPSFALMQEHGGSSCSLEEECFSKSSVWGQTCDGLDRLVESTHCLPPSLDVGDWLGWENHGAYTSAAGSGFNGFALPETIYLNVAMEEEEEEMMVVAVGK